MSTKFFYVRGQFADESEYLWRPNREGQYRFDFHCIDGFEEVKEFVDGCMSGRYSLLDKEKEVHALSGEDPGPGNYPTDYEEAYWTARRAGGGKEPYLSPISGTWVIPKPLNIAYSDFRDTVTFMGLDKPIVDKRIPSHANMKEQFVDIKLHPVKIGSQQSVGLACDYVDGDFDWTVLER